MINHIIRFSIKNKFIVGLLTLALIGVGIYSMTTVNLGSVPDITNNQVQVMTVAPNLATEDIEQFVTYPIERAMGNLPGVVEIRSVSRFGLSVVTIVFEDRMGTYLPRQLVQEKLNEVQEEIPEQFGDPFMGPITTGLGEIFQYTITPKPGYDTVYTLADLRTIQDWIVARQMTMVDGVVEINAFGGKIKQYEIAINPEKLNAMDVSIAEIFEALRRNNINTGGAYIEKNKMANFIRGEGLVRSLEDIRQIVIKNVNGLPITIADVAEKIHYGHQVRFGAFTKDGKEAVGGMVLMLKGSNPNKVIQRVKERMEKIQESLPEGLEIKPFLDRSDLIHRTTSTVQKNLLEGALIVIFVLVVLLGSLRGGIITASVIPLSLLFAFILMRFTNVWANLMSLGAIDFGIIVDGAVIIVEGTVHLIENKIKGGKRQYYSQADMDEIAYKSASTMMNSAFFGQLIILIVFAPILFLTGVEGKMFRPMAFTFGYAVLGAILLCLTYVPMMSALFMRPISNPRNWFARLEHVIERFSQKIISFLYRLYRPLLSQALRFRPLVLILAVAFLSSAVYTFSRMGGEFVPQLDEGDIAMQALLRPGSALSESIKVSNKIERLLLEHFPEVETVVGRIGVSGIPTDPMPMDIIDMFIILEKDVDKWVSATNKEELIDKIKDLLNREITGVNLVFTQPVELRFNELLTGIREDVAIKLFGEDLDILNEKKEQIARLVRTIPGVGDVSAERTSGLPQMTVRFNRRKLAQYGLDVEKLNDYISAAFAGGVAGVIFEGEKRFDMVIRFDEAHRRSIEDLRNLYIDLPDGTQVPIKEVAEIEYVPGPMQISRENTFRRTYVGINTRGRDVESVIKDIQKKLDASLDLPPGYYLRYGGEFENLQRAKARLSIVVPIALFLIFLLLYFALESFVQSIMIYMAIPLAAIGGVYSLWLRDMPFSISAGVGFIVLFGVAVLNGLVLVNRFNSLKAEGVLDLHRRIMLATEERLRPILLTATAAIMGFTPMAFSTSAGAEVQRPLATVVIGGLITATLLTLVVLPVLYSYVERLGKNGQTHLGGTVHFALWPLLALGALSLPSVAHAQSTAYSAIDTLPVLSLDEARQRALANYPVIHTAALQIQNQQVLKKTAWTLGNTSIFTGMEEVGGGTIGVYTFLGVQQSGVNVFGIKPTLALQEARVALAERALSLTRTELEREVNRAWGMAYAAKNTFRVYLQLDSIFSDLERAARLRLETQEIAQLEYLATTNQARRVHIEMQQAYRDYLRAIQMLNLWLASDTLFGVPDLPVTQLDEPLPLAVDSLIAVHPLLSVSEQQVRVAEAFVDRQRAALYPQFSGQFGLQQVDGQGGFFTFQLGVQMPLYAKPVKGRIESAQIQHQIALQNLKQTQLELQAGFRQTKEQYFKWYDAWQYYRDVALPLAQAQRQGAITAYRAGAIDYVTFLQNVRDAIGIEIDAWNAFGQYLDSKYQLEYFLQNEN